MALLCLVSFGVAASGFSATMVVCFGPDGHIAIEFAHHESHCTPRSEDGVVSLGKPDVGCTDMPAFGQVAEFARLHVPSPRRHLTQQVQQIPALESIDWSHQTFVCVIEGCDASLSGVMSLRTVVLLI